MLKAMNIGNNYGMKYNLYSNLRRGGDQEIAEDVDELKLPSKKILHRLRVYLIGEEVVENEEDGNCSQRSDPGVISEHVNEVGE